MKSILILTIGITGSLIARGQALSREQIIGVWTCTEVAYTERVTEADAVEKTRQGLVNSQFIFRSNGLFSLQLPSGAPIEFRELEAMNNKMWHFKSKERTVFVGSLDDDLLTIHVQPANGFYYFSIRDTPMVLKVVKR